MSPCSDIFLSFILTTFKTTEKLQVECIVLPVHFKCCICFAAVEWGRKKFLFTHGDTLGDSYGHEHMLSYCMHFLSTECNSSHCCIYTLEAGMIYQL